MAAIFAIAEIILIGTGVVNIVANVIQLLGIAISGRRTATHMYIAYMAAIALLQQFTSPTFHHVYTSAFYNDFDLREFLTLAFLVLLLGYVTMLFLLLLMDYFRWIGDYKIIVVTVHLVFNLLILLFWYFVVDPMINHAFLITAFAALVSLAFILTFLLHRDLECLKSRKISDDESLLRYYLVLVFISAKFAALIVFVLENVIGVLLTGWPSFGFFSLGFIQLDSVLFIIVLLRVDHKFRTSLIDLLKMCSCRRGGKVQFENLPSDNGRLLNQEV